MAAHMEVPNCCPPLPRRAAEQADVVRPWYAPPPPGVPRRRPPLRLRNSVASRRWPPAIVDRQPRHPRGRHHAQAQGDRQPLPRLAARGYGMGNSWRAARPLSSLRISSAPTLTRMRPPVGVGVDHRRFLVASTTVMPPAVHPCRDPLAISCRAAERSGCSGGLCLHDPLGGSLRGKGHVGAASGHPAHENYYTQALQARRGARRIPGADVRAAADSPPRQAILELAPPGRSCRSRAGELHARD